MVHRLIYIKIWKNNMQSTVMICCVCRCLHIHVKTSFKLRHFDFFIFSHLSIYQRLFIFFFWNKAWKVGVIKAVWCYTNPEKGIYAGHTSDWFGSPWKCPSIMWYYDYLSEYLDVAAFNNGAIHQPLSLLKSAALIRQCTRGSIHRRVVWDGLGAIYQSTTESFSYPISPFIWCLNKTHARRENRAIF